ncbi:MAG: CS1 type fimbrial major subunit [Pseudomonas sp.]|uniref:CS1 type fimbrial major subunit n=1 Tax=Pseudomonas sp. TaxID=306 RepID=UPI003D6EAB78
MSKKIVLAVPMAILALGSSMAFAANDARTSINISATIPSSQFHAQPVDADFGNDEKMAYDLVSGTLSPLRAAYNVKHTDGGVAAYVEGGPQPLFNGADTIALTYTFNGVLLSAAPQVVVSEAAAKPGIRAELVIAAAAKPAPAQVGNYTANPTIIFDALPKP